MKLLIYGLLGALVVGVIAVGVCAPSPSSERQAETDAAMLVDEEQRQAEEDNIRLMSAMILMEEAPKELLEGFTGLVAIPRTDAQSAEEFRFTTRGTSSALEFRVQVRAKGVVQEALGGVLLGEAGRELWRYTKQGIGGDALEDEDLAGADPE